MRLLVPMTRDLLKDKPVETLRALQTAWKEAKEANLVSAPYLFKLAINNLDNMKPTAYWGHAQELREIVRDMLETPRLTNTEKALLSDVYKDVSFAQSDTDLLETFHNVYTDFKGDGSIAQRVAGAFAGPTALELVTAPLVVTFGTMLLKQGENDPRTHIRLIMEAIPYCSDPYQKGKQPVLERAVETILPALANLDIKPAFRWHVLMTCANSLKPSSPLTSSLRAAIEQHMDQVLPRQETTYTSEKFLAKQLVNTVRGSLADDLLSNLLLSRLNPSSQAGLRLFQKFAKVVLRHSDIEERQREAAYCYSRHVQVSYNLLPEEVFSKVLKDALSEPPVPGPLARCAAINLINMTHEHISSFPDQTFKGLRQIVNMFGIDPDENKAPGYGIGFRAAKKVLHFGVGGHNLAQGEAYLTLKSIEKQAGSVAPLRQEARQALQCMKKPSLLRRALRGLGCNIPLTSPQHKPA